MCGGQAIDKKEPAVIWRMLYKRSIIFNNNLSFNENMKVGEDAIFFYQYILCCNKITCIPYSLYYYRCRPGSVMYKTGMKWNDRVLIANMREELSDFAVSKGYDRNKIQELYIGSTILSYVSIANQLTTEMSYRNAVKNMKNIRNIPAFYNAYKKLKLKFKPKYFILFFIIKYKFYNTLYLIFTFLNKLNIPITRQSI